MPKQKKPPITAPISGLSFNLPHTWVNILSVRKKVSKDGHILGYEVAGESKTIHEAIGPLCEAGVKDHAYLDTFLTIASNLIAASQSHEEMLEIFTKNTENTRRKVLDIVEGRALSPLANKDKSPQ